ncbi:MAG TPA: ArsR family transcriptional regulator [Euzebya sp.]|nr:ArsR family transcriptional regulator [Euzebya sp.]
MTAAEDGDLAARAMLYRALGDPSRLAIVELVATSDRTPGELGECTGLDWNLLGFHLRALEAAGVIQRHRSEGDGRRRYVCLRPGALNRLDWQPTLPVGTPLFLCTHNSARSPFAAALWTSTTGLPAGSAGSDPAATVHPLAVDVAGEYGVDLSAARPRGYHEVTDDPDIVVSVCDRAFEGDVPLTAPRMHWSVPDPSTRARPTFQAAFADIAERISRLAANAA